MEVISYFVPVFLVFIFSEWLWSARLKKGYYRWVDTLSDMSTGVLNQVFTVLIGAIAIGLYSVIYNSFHFIEMVNLPWWMWGVGLFASDISYYWFHRISHERNILWLMHVPHHQSEEYNFSVALRQGIVEFLGSMWFHLPWALLGFPPEWYFTCVGLNTVFQFFVHTRGIDKIPLIEGIINTPASHRVHHACDPHYLDKNYAGMFTFLDRIFGTYKAETVPPTYGTVTALSSWNPLWANYALIHKINLLSEGKGMMAWCRLWLSSPADLVSGEFPIVLGREKYHTEPNKYSFAYIAVLYLYTAFSLLMLLFVSQDWTVSSPKTIGLSVLVIWTCFNMGGLTEMKSWFKISEICRLILGVLYASFLFDTWALGISLMLLVLGLVCVLIFRIGTLSQTQDSFVAETL